MVTANEVFSNNSARWIYTVERAEITSPHVDQPVASIITGSSARTVSAINLGEMSNLTEPAANVAWYINGKNLHATDWPSGILPRPIGGGGTDNTHKRNEYVWLWTTKMGGSALFVFNVPTNIDGGC